MKGPFPGWFSFGIPLFELIDGSWAIQNYSYFLFFGKSFMNFSSCFGFLQGGTNSFEIYNNPPNWGKPEKPAGGGGLSTIGVYQRSLNLSSICKFLKVISPQILPHLRPSILRKACICKYILHFSPPKRTSQHYGEPAAKLAPPPHLCHAKPPALSDRG